MGYLRMPVVESELPSDEEPANKVRIKGSLANTAEQQSAKKFITYFCAINFNLRQFAMIKMKRKVQ